MLYISAQCQESRADSPARQLRAIFQSLYRRADAITRRFTSAPPRHERRSLLRCLYYDGIIGFQIITAEARWRAGRARGTSRARHYSRRRSKSAEE